jgi:hypothetical protein
MFSFGSGDVSWSSKKQLTVALLSTEAKYRGVTIVACEVIWLQKLLSDLGQSVHAPVVIYCDNINSILLANNLVYHTKTKHIKVHYHFIREKLLAKEINLIHVSTEDQVADIFTKALCHNPTLAKCGGEAQHLEKLEIWSPLGLPNVQSSIARPKTPRIEVLVMSLKRS